MDGVTLTVTSVRTAYDAPHGAVTVATPSCCCCCCCCLATVSSLSTFITSEAHFHASENKRSAAPAIALALLSVPVALLALLVNWNIGPSEGLDSLHARWIIAVAVFFGFSVSALLAAGTTWSRALGTSCVLGVGAVVLIVVEVFIALFTVFIIEIASPLFAYLAHVASRGMHRSRTGWQPTRQLEVPYPTRTPFTPPSFPPPTHPPAGPPTRPEP